MGEGEPQGERNTSPHACVHEARKCMPSHTDRLIPRPLLIQALPTDTLGEDWDVLREPSSLGGGRGEPTPPGSSLFPPKIIFLTLSLKGLGREAKRRELCLYSDLSKDKNLEVNLG